MRKTTFMSNPDAASTDSSSRFRQGGWWGRIVAGADPVMRRRLIWATWVLLAVIGLADFLTGFQISLLVFYFLPVALAVAASGRRFGCVTALLCVATWLFTDIAAGARYSNLLVLGWNAAIVFGTYLVLIWLLSSLIDLQRQLETRVRERTAALTEEIVERGRLERALLETGERERRAVGRDLHDGLGQHLTGTALVAQALAARLNNRGAGEAEEARKVVELVEQGIEQTRRVAKGLVLGEIERDSLPAALRELAAWAESHFRLRCVIRAAAELPLESVIATHLYRIAQEAVSNAARHGRAREVVISLASDHEALLLQVRDDGVGITDAARRGPGLGLRIMQHRAAIIGGRFTVEAAPGRGTLVACRLPHPNPPPP